MPHCLHRSRSGEGGWDDVRPWHRVAPGADITCWWYRSGVFRPDDRGPLRFGGTGGFEWFGRHAGAGGDADKILGGVDLFAVHGDVADLQVGVGDAQLHEQAEDPQDDERDQPVPDDDGQRRTGLDGQLLRVTVEQAPAAEAGVLAGARVLDL